MDIETKKMQSYYTFNNLGCQPFAFIYIWIYITIYIIYVISQINDLPYGYNEVDQLKALFTSPCMSSLNAIRKFIKKSVMNLTNEHDHCIINYVQNTREKYECMSVCACARDCMCVCFYARECVRVCVRAFSGTCACVFGYARVCICTCACTCTCTCTCTCVYVRAHVYVHAHVHVHVYRKKTV